VLLSLAAYILFQTLQAHAQGTACADAQVSTLRERLLKLAAWVERRCGALCCTCPPGAAGSPPGGRSRGVSPPHRRKSAKVRTPTDPGPRHLSPIE
jgi:hypothetical protein